MTGPRNPFPALPPIIGHVWPEGVQPVSTEPPPPRTMPTDGEDLNTPSAWEGGARVPGLDDRRERLNIADPETEPLWIKWYTEVRPVSVGGDRLRLEIQGASGLGVTMTLSELTRLVHSSGVLRWMPSPEVEEPHDEECTCTEVCAPWRKPQEHQVMAPASCEQGTVSKPEDGGPGFVFTPPGGEPMTEKEILANPPFEGTS